MKIEKILERIKRCKENNLCFISLNRLEDELFINTIDFYVGKDLVVPVKVISRFAKY